MLRILITVPAFAAMFPTAAAAEGAWPADELQLRFGAEAFSGTAKSQYTATGDRIELLDPASPGGVTQRGVELEAEFGLFEDVSIFTATTLHTIRYESEAASATVSGLGDARIGGQWAFLHDPITLTAEPSLTFPTGYTPDGGAYVPSLGNGVNQYEVRIWVGQRFEDPAFRFELGVGYRFRGTRVPRGGGAKLIYADEVPYDLRVGFEPLDDLELLGLLGGAYGLGTPDIVDRVHLYPRTEKYLWLGVGVGYRFFDWFSALATYRTTAAGVNALDSQFLSLTTEFRYEVGS